MKNCKICGGNNRERFRKIVLQKYEAVYLQCNDCKFLGIYNVNWLEEAYSKAINICDTGLLSRCIYNSKLTSILLFLFYSNNSKILDFAGGNGVFTRLLRDVGFNCFWFDQFAENIHSEGFSGSVSKYYDLVTTFESLEHFNEPLSELEKILATKSDLFFSTSLQPKSSNEIENWSYLGLNHGQHISFFSKKSLEIIASKFGYEFYTDGCEYHLFTKRKYLVNPIMLIRFFKKLGIFIFIKKMKKSLTLIDSSVLMSK